MGLFGNKESNPGQAGIPGPEAVLLVERSGAEDVEVSGESYHRSEIAAMFQGWGFVEGGVKMCHAVLVREPTNKYDPNAVKVLVDNHHVGYVDANYAEAFSAALKRLKRGQYGYVAARAWGTNDDGTWRARVTLNLSGETEREHDYAAERKEGEANQAEREQNRAEREQKRAERDALKVRKQAARDAATIDGMYWGNYQEAIRELKRQKRLEDARALLAKCVEAAELEGRMAGAVPDPWPADQLAAMLVRAKEGAAALSLLERYERACNGAPVPDKIAQRLVAVRLTGDYTT